MSAELDRILIHELINLHGHLMDAGAFERLDELFTEDIVYDLSAYGSGTLHGRGAIAEAGRALGDRNPLGHHVTKVVVKELTETVGRVVSMGMGVNSDGTVGSVTYHDSVRRTPTGWRISSGQIIPRRRPLHPKAVMLEATTKARIGILGFFRWLQHPMGWCVVTIYSLRIRPDLLQVFWAGMQAGDFLTDAVLPLGVDRRTGARILVAAGGVRPRRGRDLKGRCLTFADREEIAVLRAQGKSLRQIGAVIGRPASTISRELSRNTARGSAYRATTAHLLSYERAGRPKPAKLHINAELRAKVEDDLQKKYSPEQISGRLKRDFPDREEMRVSPETIYQSLYVQSRGALKQELTRYLRTGRALRSPSRKPGQRKNRIPDMVNISKRPAEASDRAVPGSWEGDLIIGKGNLTAIGTLVERSTNYTMLVHLPEGYTAEKTRDALTAKIKTLPEALRGTLTWDQGVEMREWKQVAVDAGIEIFFCDPHSPWQRGINENTNGLLRQYFPKGTDLSVHSEADLDWVAAELNDRPRKRLAFQKPIEAIGKLLLQ